MARPTRTHGGNSVAPRRARPGARELPVFDVGEIEAALEAMQAFARAEAQEVENTQTARLIRLLAFLDTNEPAALGDAVCLVARREALTWKANSSPVGALVQIVYRGIAAKRRGELETLCVLFEDVDPREAAAIIRREGGVDPIMRRTREQRDSLRREGLRSSPRQAVPQPAPVARRGEPTPTAPPAARRGTDSAGRPRPSRRGRRCGD